MVSVIIPVYNVEDYLDECMESVVNQTFKNIEIILINDGSTDGSDKICLEWAKRDDRIIYVSKNNEGLGLTRNLGIKISKYDYVAFIDSDDWWELDFVEKMYSAIVKNNADICVCGAYTYDMQSNEVTEYKMKIHYESVKKNPEMIYNIFPHMPYKIYKKQIFIENDIKMPALPFEDTATTPLILALSNKVCYVDECLYYYRINRGGSITNTCTNRIKLSEAFSYLFYEFQKREILDLYAAQLKMYAFINIRYTYKKIISLDEETYKKIEKDIFDCMETYFPENKKLFYSKILAIGSYNLYSSVFSMVCDINKLIYFGSTSLISAFSPKIKAAITHTNKFRENILNSDFNGELLKLKKSQLNEISYVFIDFLDERFDLIKKGNTYYTKNEAFDDISSSLDFEYQVINRMDVTELWKTSCLKFIKFLKSNFQPNQIFLFKIKLSQYYGESEKEFKFENQEEILKINNMLDECYDFFQDNYEGVNVIDLGCDELYYTDKNFRHGCLPYHLNDRIYKKYAETVISELGEN